MVAFWKKMILFFFLSFLLFGCSDKQVLVVKSGVSDVNGLDVNFRLSNSNLLGVGGEYIEHWSDLNSISVTGFDSNVWTVGWLNDDNSLTSDLNVNKHNIVDVNSLIVGGEGKGQYPFEVYGSNGILMASEQTNSTNKNFRMTTLDYDSSKKVMIVQGTTSNTVDAIRFGGGSSSFYPTQRLYFYAGQDTGSPWTGNIQLSINEFGYVSLGTLTPKSKFHIYKGNSGSGVPSSTVQTIESNGYEYLTFLTPSGEFQSKAGLIFGNPSDTDAGKIYYHGYNNNLIFSTNSNDRVWITSNGHVGIGDNDPTYMLELPNIASVEGQIRANDFIKYSNANNKTNIAQIGANELGDLYDSIDDLNVKSYLYIDNNVCKSYDEWYDETLNNIDLETLQEWAYTNGYIENYSDVNRETQELYAEQNGLITYHDTNGIAYSNDTNECIVVVEGKSDGITRYGYIVEESPLEIRSYNSVDENVGLSIGNLAGYNSALIKALKYGTDDKINYINERVNDLGDYFATDLLRVNNPDEYNDAKIAVSRNGYNSTPINTTPLIMLQTQSGGGYHGLNIENTGIASGTSLVFQTGSGGSLAYTPDGGTTYPFYVNNDGKIHTNGDFDFDGKLTHTPTNTKDRSEISVNPLDAISLVGATVKKEFSTSAGVYACVDGTGDYYIDFPIHINLNQMGGNISIREIYLLLYTETTKDIVEETYLYSNNNTYEIIMTDTTTHGTGTGLETATIYNNKGVDTSEAPHFLEVKVHNETDCGVKIRGFLIRYEET